MLAQRASAPSQAARPTGASPQERQNESCEAILRYEPLLNYRAAERGREQGFDATVGTSTARERATNSCLAANTYIEPYGSHV
jgi:hypothetical protein